MAPVNRGRTGFARPSSAPSGSGPQTRVDVPNAMDRVPDITQEPVKPGKKFVYEFVAKGPAVGMYHSHHHAEHQMPDGLDTVNVAPGERYSVLVQATNPGVWAWHCHILTHAERDTGMFGMVTTLIVEA